MDKKRVVLVLGLCFVLAGALSGCVDQTQNASDTTDDGAPGANGGGGDGGGSGGEDGGDGGGAGEADEIDVDTSNMSVECSVEDDVISPEETEDVPDKYSNAGPAFDGRQAEAMLHGELNELRTTHGNDSVEPLLCDPNLREIAREHSRVMEEFRFIGSAVPEDEIPEDRNITTNPEYGNLSVRYEGVCREPVEARGGWLYQRNRDINWEGGVLTQREDVDVIQNHEDLVRDMRGVWFTNRENLRTPLSLTELVVEDEGSEGIGDVRESMEYLTDGNYTRQGIGMHINRQTRGVYVTQVLC